MEALEHAALLGVEPEIVAARVDRIDAREQRAVRVHGAVWAASSGAISRSTACSAGDVSLEVRLSNGR